MSDHHQLNISETTETNELETCTTCTAEEEYIYNGYNHFDLPNQPTTEELMILEREFQTQLAEQGLGENQFVMEAITVPVAFHVIYNSQGQGNIPDAQIDDQIEVLNSAFANMGFSFDLVTVDRTQNDDWFDDDVSSDPSEYKAALSVDPATTLNIYSTQPRSGILGFVEAFPSQAPEDDPIHGVTVLYASLPGGTAEPYNEGDTATHEVGHYVGLYHTWGNVASCFADDSVRDTNRHAEPNFGDPVVPPDTCPLFPGSDPIENFMNYTDDAVMDEFTTGQATRAQQQVALYKPSLGTTVSESNPLTSAFVAMGTEV